MAPHYCTDQDLLDYLPTDLTGSVIASTAQRTAKLRTPARAWVDSVLPGRGPWPNASDALDWLVNQSNHQSGESSVTIDGGSGTPAVGEVFRVTLDNQYSSDLQDFLGQVDDAQWYKVTAYASSVLTYTPMATADFEDDAPIEFGCPRLIRDATQAYALHLAFGILNEQPDSKQATWWLDKARNLLQVPKDAFLGTAQVSTGEERSRMSVPLMRA